MIGNFCYHSSVKKVFWLIIMFFVMGCYYDVEPPVIKVEPKITKNDVLLVAKEFKYMGLDVKTRVKSWELISESSIVYKNDEVHLENIEIKFYKKGKIVSVLKGDRGKLYSKKNSAEILTNVVLENYENNTKILSSRLIWDGNRRLIYNTLEDKTTIISREAVLKGTGLRTTPEVYPLELQNVEAVVQ